MIVRARANYIRMSPRKVRLVADLVRGLTVQEAETQLRFLSKKAAPILLKLLRSAIANADDRGNIDLASLLVKSITADGGPTLKRSQPRAFGRATPIRRRSAHVTIILEGKEGIGRPREEKKKKENAENVPTAHGTYARATNDVSTKAEGEAHRPEAVQPGRVVKRAEPRAMPPSHGPKSKGFLKRLFSRKTGSS